MFETLAPKLNGGKFPTKQNTNGNSSDNGRINNGPVKSQHDAANTRNNSIKINSQQDNSTSSGSGSIQSPSSSRPLFANLRTNGPFQSKPISKQPSTEIISKGDTTHVTQQSSRPVVAPDNPTTRQTPIIISPDPISIVQEADESFGDLENNDFVFENLDDDDDGEYGENSKEFDDSIVSWPPTLPKETSRSAPSSQISQKASSSSQSAFTPNIANIQSSNVVSKSTSGYSVPKTHSINHSIQKNHASSREIETVRSKPYPSPIPTTSSRILVPNSQEIPSSRSSAADVKISLKSRNANSELSNQENQGFVRSHSSPSAGTRGKSTGSVQGGRKLPGPAGNLPKLSPEERIIMLQTRGVVVNTVTPSHSSTDNANPESLIKKSSKTVSEGQIDGLFTSGAWEDMIRAYNLPDYKPSTLLRYKGTSPMIKFSISDIESRSELHRSKIPDLVVMVKEVSTSEIDAAVTLLDPSGEMRGTMHSTVLERYKNNEIKIGTVLVLKNVSVFSPTPVSHYLIITLRNIERIFQPRSSLSQSSSQDKMSQKRKMIDDESQNFRSPKQSTQESDMPVGVDDKSFSLSPYRNNDLISSTPTATTKKSSASLEMLNMTLLEENSATGEHKKIRSEQTHIYNNADRSSSNNSSNYLPHQHHQQHQTQTQEIQFQSLRPMINNSRSEVASEYFSSTPIISLSAMTPNNEERKSVLSSFAASPNLRKRSSQSQKSNTSSSPTQSSKKPFASPIKSPPILSSSQRTDSFTSWNDDFDAEELGKAMTSDISNDSINVWSPGNSQSKPQASVPQPPTLVDVAEDDDYDELFAAIDEEEAELLGI